MTQIISTVITRPVLSWLSPSLLSNSIHVISTGDISDQAMAVSTSLSLRRQNHRDQQHYHQHHFATSPPEHWGLFISLFPAKEWKKLNEEVLKCLRKEKQWQIAPSIYLSGEENTDVLFLILNLSNILIIIPLILNEEWKEILMSNSDTRLHDTRYLWHHWVSSSSLSSSSWSSWVAASLWAAGWTSPATHSH